MDEVEQGQAIKEIAPNGIVRLIAGAQQLDFFALFEGTEKDDSGAYLVFRLSPDKDYKIRVGTKAPLPVENGTLFYGTEDYWRIRAATPEETTQFNAMMEEDS